MHILPVTLLEMDIYCCGDDHEAVIGERWQCPVIFGAMFWEEATVDEPHDSIR